MKKLLFLIFISLYFFACKTEPATVVADLSTVPDSVQMMLERYEGLQAGGGERVKRPAVVLENTQLSYEPAQKALKLDISDTTWKAEIAITLLALPTDWKAFGQLAIDVQHTGSAPIDVIFSLVGARNQMTERRQVANGSTFTFTKNLIDLPLIAGTQPPFSPVAIRVEGDCEQPPCQIFLSKLTLTAKTDTTDLACIDRFGQRKLGAWQGKITEEAQLKQSVEAERAALLGQAAPTDRDPYGGWTKAGGKQATGFFRVEQSAEGKWLLITPDGHPFWSIGVTGVRQRSSANLSDVTLVKGREFLFDEIPPRNGDFTGAWQENDYVSFYYTNLIRKYGSLEKWREMTFLRLKGWGLNTLGNWSDTLFFNRPQMPFTYAIFTNRNEKLRGIANFPDVFNPEWETYAEQNIREATVYRDNPYLIGYFIDNEQPWRNLSVLRSAAGIPMRQAWATFLQGKYASLDALNQAWQTQFDSWETARDWTGSEPLSAEIQADIDAFSLILADKYFSTVSRLLRKYDTNHLYLGCRFVRQRPSEGILKIAAKYVDVFSYNSYSYRPEEARDYYRITQKPILIGEFHYPLQSERQHPPLYRCFTEEERHQMLQNYVAFIAQEPYSIGCHWYQWADQHLSGRGLDGENQVVGLVDITDQPHTELVEAFRKIAQNLPAWRGIQ